MRSYKDLAINSKLTLLVVLSGSVALLLSCIAFVTNDVRMIRSSMIDADVDPGRGARVEQHGGPQFRRRQDGQRTVDVAGKAAGRRTGLHL